MYEEMTYEGILRRMLERIPEDMDKREGSPIYVALAPAAVEMQLIYIEFDAILNDTFGDTASRDFLIRRASERGLKPRGASKAVLKAVGLPETLEIPVGARFTLQGQNYIVLESMGAGIYKVQCELYGVRGNQYFGDGVPIDYIQGLEKFTISQVVIPGEDEEGTEEFRKRYFNSFDAQSFSGNRQDYIEKTNALPGVGSTKVIRAWNGVGTVKLVILDSNFNRASDALISAVQKAIDPKQGDGDGLAPLDHIVTVSTVEEVSILVATSFVFDVGYNFLDLKSKIVGVIQEYFYDLKRAWDLEKTTLIRIKQIEAKLLSIQGILDVQGTSLNGSVDNLSLSEYQIPVFGGINNV